MCRIPVQSRQLNDAKIISQLIDLYKRFQPLECDPIDVFFNNRVVHTTNWRRYNIRSLNQKSRDYGKREVNRYTK